MVRLGVVSDSHDSTFFLERYAVLCKRERYDAIIHLGDYETDARWLEGQIGCPLISVPGNCDIGSRASKEVQVRYEGHRILAVHGHRQDVKWRYDLLAYRAEEVGADVALFGHTHEACVERSGSVLLMNPGALMDGCYGELTIDGARLVPMLRQFGKRRA